MKSPRSVGITSSLTRCHGRYFVSSPTRAARFKPLALPRTAIDNICQKVDSRYTLVVESAKRARQLIDGALPMIDRKDRKPLSCAVEEINRGLLVYHRNLEDEEA